MITQRQLIFFGQFKYLPFTLYLAFLLAFSSVTHVKNSFSSDNESLQETVYTFPISGEIRDAFSGKPLTGAIARFIILPDSISFSSDNLGYFNGKWTSVEEAVVDNYPNPFNPSTTIQFPAGYDILEIYTILGQRLARVDVHTESQIELEMASGVYIYRLRDNETGKVAQNKMIALDGGYFTIYFEKTDRSQHRPRNMFNKSNANFDDFSEVRIMHDGYAVLDTNVRLIEGVRNNFLFNIKPQMTFILNGSIRDNYGNAIYNARCLLIKDPLNKPDTLFNQVVSSSFSTSNIVKVVRVLDHVMIKVISYGHDTFVQYITLNPGVNYKEIELVKPLNDFILYGHITDYMTNENLEKKISISGNGILIDTLMSSNGNYEVSISDTAKTLIVDLGIADDEMYKGGTSRITVYPHTPAQADMELMPRRIGYYIEGTITDTRNKKTVAGAEVSAILGDSTLATTITDAHGKYRSPMFYYTQPQMRAVRFQVLSNDYETFREYLTLHLGQNKIDRALKP